MTSPRWRRMGNTWLSTIFLLFIANLFTVQSAENNVLFEYFPSSPKSTSDILRATLTEQDYASKFKILPERKDAILKLSYRQEISLVYAVVNPGPLSLSISPCCGVLKWELYWRPTFLNDVEIVQAENFLFNDTLLNFLPRKVIRDDIIISNEIPGQQRSRRTLKKKRGVYGVTHVFERNFTTPDIESPTMKYIYKNNKPILEVHLSRGEGRDPWLFHKEVIQPGLYIIKVRSLSEYSRVHALASMTYVSDMQHHREMESFKAKDNFKRHAVTLTWSSRNDEENLFCLVVSRQKFYSSLCAARELQRSSRKLPTSFVDNSLILGCTPNTHYTLPANPNSKYFVSVWQQGSIIPLVQAVVKAKPHRKVPRLKTGVMVSFTLTAGGQANAKFHVKKKGKKLHVAAVSCYGGVSVVVSAGKERVAAAKGREALHLAVRHAPKAKLTIKVSPMPPIQALYRVHLVATHSARKLPIPRLPKIVEVQVSPLNCSSAKVRWSKAPGGGSYCVVMQHHPSGRPPEIRPPLQCGWESVIKRRDYFRHLDCFNGTSLRKQKKIVHGFPANESFIVNILVRHPVTGRTLTLAPVMLNMPSCPEIDNRTALNSSDVTLNTNSSKLNNVIDYKKHYQ